jgi:hypothetical protein
MITELTQAQKDRFPYYVDKWIKIGTDTSNPSYDETLEIVTDFRDLIKLPKTNNLIVVENPIEAWVICVLHEMGVPITELIDEMKLVFDGNPKKRDIPRATLPYQTGSFFVSTFSFYDYFIEELKIDVPADLLKKYKVWERTSQIGMIYPLDDLTVVCKKPSEIHLNENRVLHRDGGPALSYSGHGDFKIYSLNGVRVPQWLAETPSHKLEVSRYNEIDNADVKAEFVRKVGVEAFIEMSKKIDTYENYDENEYDWWYKSQYELYDMSFLYPSFSYAPHLKMLNQTTGVWHVEAVSPECRTLRDAIKERFGGREMKIIAIA